MKKTMTMGSFFIQSGKRWPAPQNSDTIPYHGNDRRGTHSRRRKLA